jgi:hypothetical protein
MPRLSFMHGAPNRQQYLGPASGVGRAVVMVETSRTAESVLRSFMVDAK